MDANQQEIKIKLNCEQQFIFILPDDNNFVLVHEMRVGIIPNMPTVYIGHIFYCDADARDYDRGKVVEVYLDCDFNCVYGDDD